MRETDTPVHGVPWEQHEGRLSVQTKDDAMWYVKGLGHWQLGSNSSSDNLCDLRQFSLSQSLSPHSLKNGDREIFKVLSIFKILLFYDSKPVN